MKKIELDKLINITNENELFEIYPKTKSVDSYLTHIFYNIKPNVWIRCSYMLNNGFCCRDNMNSIVEKDINYHKFKVDKVYIGNEKIEEYKDIWNYKIK